MSNIVNPMSIAGNVVKEATPIIDGALEGLSQAAAAAVTSVPFGVAAVAVGAGAAAVVLGDFLDAAHGAAYDAFAGEEPRGTGNDETPSRHDSDAGTGAGDEPPRQNPNIRRVPDDRLDYFAIFEEKLKKYMKRFGISLTRQEKFLEIFRRLEGYQKNHFTTTIKNLMRNGTLDKAIALTLLMFNDLSEEDIEYMNFLNLMEFVSAFIQENRFKKKMEILRLDRLALSFVMRKILKLFKEIIDKINNNLNSNAILPYFRSKFSAAYHYMKHRIIPDTESEMLSVQQYHYWLRRLLEEAKDLPEFSELADPENSRKTLTYEHVVHTFHRRMKLVLKFQGDKVVVASLHLIYTIYPEDKDGDVFIDGKKQ